MSEQEEQKPGEYIIGLTLGTVVAGAAWFLYKTKKGKRLRSWWDKYFNELKDEWAKLQEQEAEPLTLPKPVRKPRSHPEPKKKTFHQSGRPLVK
ncbi:MAG: YtxH domain-containing protein [Patescibacteria group bacterium]|nr:YtxH domain-containing protein [Candidatus Beckwithbacteria bacterium]MDZ4229035.1 YtxH domain-containing protein [Patescibacteria group bacterium]